VLVDPLPNDADFPHIRIFAKEMHVVDWSQAWDVADGMDLIYGHPDTWSTEDEALLLGRSPGEPNEGIVYRVGPPKGFKGRRHLRMEARIKREKYMSRKAQKSMRVGFRKWLGLVPSKPTLSQLEELRKDPEFLNVAEFQEENTQLEKIHNMKQADEYLDYLLEEFLGQARELHSFANIFRYRESREELIHIFNYKEDQE
jgi:hypothetical protein